MRNGVGALGAFLVVLAILAPAARAEWSPPFELSDAQESSVSPAVAMGTGGDAIIAWYRINADASDAGYRATVRRGSSFAPSVAVGEPRLGQDAADNGTDFPPSVAMNRSGQAVVLSHHGQRLTATIVAADATSGHDELVTTAAGFFPYERVFIDDAGDITAFWSTDQDVFAAVRPAGGTFTAPQRLTTDAQGRTGYPQYAVDPRTGHAMAGFGVGDKLSIVERTSRTGSFGPAIGVNDDAALDAGSVLPLIADNGDAALILGGDDAQGNDTYDSRVRPAGADSFKPFQRLPGVNLTTPAFAIARDGTLGAVFASRPDFAPYMGSAAIKPPGQDWGSLEPLPEDAPVEVETPRAGFAADGTLWAAWRYYTNRTGSPYDVTSYDATVYAASRTPSGGWHANRVSRTDGNVWPLALATSPDRPDALVVYPQTHRNIGFFVTASDGTPPPAPADDPTPAAEPQAQPSPAVTTGAGDPAAQAALPPAPAAAVAPATATTTTGSGRRLARYLTRRAAHIASRARRGLGTRLQIPAPGKTQVVRVLVYRPAGRRWLPIASQRVPAGSRTVRLVPTQGARPLLRRIGGQPRLAISVTAGNRTIKLAAP